MSLPAIWILAVALGLPQGVHPTTDRDLDGLRGPVSVVEDRIASPTGPSDTKWTKRRPELTSRTTYDKQGHKQRHLYFESGKVSVDATTVTDANGDKTIRVMESFGTPDFVAVAPPGNSDPATPRATLDDDGALLYYDDNHYSESGRLLERLAYTGTKADSAHLLKRHVYEYDEFGKVMAQVEYTTSGVEYLREEYEYSASGIKTLTRRRFGASSTWSETDTFVSSRVDRFGNWTVQHRWTQTEGKPKVLLDITYRTIMYHTGGK